MKSNLMFSVGIPVYKGRYLEECISSILNQSFLNFELIIVNDLSPDPVDEIIAKFDDNRIKYFKNKKNTGAENVVKNWNKCLNEAKGEFFILMGDDDRMETNYLEEFTRLILKYPNLDVYHCRSKIIDSNSNPITLTSSWPEHETVYENIWHKIHANRVSFISDFVYRTKKLQDRGGFYNLPLAWASDDISSFIAIGEKGIAHTNMPVFNYRRHSSSISASGNLELKMKALMLKHDWLKNFLLSKPSSSLDLIFYNDISRNLKKRIQREKIQIITTALNNNLSNNFLNWSKKRKKYGLSFIDIFYAFSEQVKMRLVAKIYDKHTKVK